MLASANWGLLPGYTVIGITLGGIYALAAIGLVLIYRVSGVLNFAQGAVSMFSAFVAYQVSTVMGAPAVVGLLAAIVAGGAIGYVIERFTIRPLAGPLGAEQGRGDDRLAARSANGRRLDLGPDGVSPAGPAGAHPGLHVPRHLGGRRLGRVHDDRRRPRPGVRHRSGAALDDLRHLDAGRCRRPRRGSAVGNQREPGDGGLVGGRLRHGRDRRSPDHAAHQLRSDLADDRGDRRVHRRPHRPAHEPAVDGGRCDVPRPRRDLSPHLLVERRRRPCGDVRARPRDAGDPLPPGSAPRAAHLGRAGVRAGPRHRQPPGPPRRRGRCDRARDRDPVAPLELLPVARGVLADRRVDRAVARRVDGARRSDLVLPVLVRRDRRLHRRVPRRGPRLELLAGAAARRDLLDRGRSAGRDPGAAACRACSWRS